VKYRTNLVAAPAMPGLRVTVEIGAMTIGFDTFMDILKIFLGRD
jgi:nucleoside permease NupC